MVPTSLSTECHVSSSQWWSSMDLGTRVLRWIYDTFQEGRRGGGPTRSLSNRNGVYRREVGSPLLNFPPITNLKCCSHGHLHRPVPLPSLTAKQRPRAPCPQTRTWDILALTQCPKFFKTQAVTVPQATAWVTPSHAGELTTWCKHSTENHSSVKN